MMSQFLRCKTTQLGPQIVNYPGFSLMYMLPEIFCILTRANKGIHVIITKWRFLHGSKQMEAIIETNSDPISRK